MPGDAKKTDSLDPLVLPIDKEILRYLTNGRRQTPRNLTAALNTDDYTRNYIGNRLRNLEHRGYTYSPGPAERSGMYEITSWGRVAEHHINQYDRGYDTLFHELVIRTVDTQPDPNRSSSDHPPDNPNPTPDPHSDTITDWIQLSNIELDALRSIVDIHNITIPSDFTNHISSELTTNDAANTLYTLYFYQFADRRDGMDAYVASDIARDLITSEAADAIITALSRGIERSELIDQYAIEIGSDQFS